MILSFLHLLNSVGSEELHPLSRNDNRGLFFSSISMDTLRECVSFSQNELLLQIYIPRDHTWDLGCELEILQFDLFVLHWNSSWNSFNTIGLLKVTQSVLSCCLWSHISLRVLLDKIHPHFLNFLGSI